MKVTIECSYEVEELPSHITPHELAELIGRTIETTVTDALVEPAPVSYGTYTLLVMNDAEDSLSDEALARVVERLDVVAFDLDEVQSNAYMTVLQAQIGEHSPLRGDVRTTHTVYP